MDATIQPPHDLPRGPLEGHFSRPIQPLPATDNMLSRLEYQERRIKQIESALAQSASTSDAPPTHRSKASRFPLTPESVQAHHGQEAGNAVNDRETMLLRGKSFKTQFHGTTHPGALLAHIPELNLFTREAFERFPALQRIRTDMHALEDRTDYADAQQMPVNDHILKSLLSNREEADELVHLYVDSYDSIYHIFHLPSFWREYNEMWSDLTKASAHFVAALLLMIASARCLRTTQSWLYTANSSTAREKAVAAIVACEDWIGRQSQKHVKAADFQIRCLLWLAKQVSARKYKRTWTEAGNLLRFCMAAGLHRNPDLLRKHTSQLDKELRKRVWATVVDIELQASFDRGMISAPWGLQSDCPPPSNVHDDEFDQSSEQILSTRAAEDFTSTSYLSLSSQTVMLRSTLNAVLNNIRQALSFDDVKQYTDEIESHLQSLPEWIGDSAERPHALLSLKLLQYQTVLHDRQVRQAETVAEKRFSKMMLIDTATKIIDIHRSLTSKNSYALEILCNDQLRAALSVCHVATVVDPHADDALSQVINMKAPRLLNEAIEMLTDKVVRFGREQRQLWICLAANGYMKAKQDPSGRAIYMQEAVDKITRPYYKIMACQENEPSRLPSGAPDKQHDMPNGMLEYMPPVEGQFGTSLDTPLLDLDAIADWTFEDWSLAPMELSDLADAAFQA